MNKIIPIPAFKDNYIWTIHSLQGSEILVVDPGDADPVLEYLRKNDLTLHAILLTHHHQDHSGGILKLIEKFPNVLAYGSTKERVAGINHFVQEGDEILLHSLGVQFKVLDIPGHTLGHIAFYNDKWLFCGDTLFSCGCGRIFEGTPEQMYQSLEKIKNLKSSTLIFCGHEYTLANIHFAQMVDPTNANLKNRYQEVVALREKNLPTLPSRLSEELKINPFLRCEYPLIKQSVQHHWNLSLNHPSDIFGQLRRWKNQIS